jgi:hypothetical protein
VPYYIPFWDKDIINSETIVSKLIFFLIIFYFASKIPVKKGLSPILYYNNLDPNNTRQPED